MLNSALNADWSNSVPGRQIPEGSTMAGLGRRHLAFANCVLNQRFAVVTAGSCDGLASRPAIWSKMLFLFLLFFPYNSNKLRSRTESCLFSSMACCQNTLKYSSMSAVSPRVCDRLQYCKTFAGLNVPCLWYYTIHVANCLLFEFENTV